MRDRTSQFVNPCPNNLDVVTEKATRDNHQGVPEEELGSGQPEDKARDNGPYPEDVAVANATTYFTVPLGTLYELTKYRHEALGHASLQHMIRIYQSMNGFPKELTAEALRKHFDSSCEACKQVTMQRNAPPKKSFTMYSPGSRCAIDVVDYMEMDIGNHSKALHTVDVGSAAYSVNQVYV